ncbi:MAG: hypothetical protein ACR5K7_05685 [Symbiopectobacterium sp.]
MSEIKKRAAQTPLPLTFDEFLTAGGVRQGRREEIEQADKRLPLNRGVNSKQVETQEQLWEKFVVMHHAACL